MIEQLDQLFTEAEFPLDESGALPQLAAMLADLRPQLLFLARGGEAPVAAFDFWQEDIRRLLAPTAEAVALRLQSAPFAAFPVEGESARRVGFGVRLHFPDDGYLGGLLDADQGQAEEFTADAALQALTPLAPALASTGSVAWTAHQGRWELHRAQSRVRQLQNQQRTLRVAYETALSTSLDEQQKRLAAEQDYSRRLEQDVARRSAELRLALEAAQEASRAKSRFLANVTHEIRTPMTAILGFTDILLQRELDPEAADAASTIRRNGEHLLHLVNDLLDFSRMEAGKMLVECVPCSPSELIEDVISLFRIPARQKSLALTTEGVESLPTTIVTDPNRLRQALINLVGNAMKFTEQGGVRIAARLLDPQSDAPRLQLDVVDSGVGIPPEKHDEVFQAFAQVDATTTRKYGGTGLGLTISKQIAQLLGGDIVISSLPGQGSTFSLTIATGPADQLTWSSSAPPQETAATESAPRLSKRRILLAEDGPDNQRFIQFILTREGALVEVVEDGRAALERALTGTTSPDGAETHPFDVILMDVQMPVMDGLDATRRLREAGYRQPIIALTAQTLSEDRRRCLEAGCDDFQAKPIQSDALIDLVARYCLHSPIPEASDEARRMAPA